MNVHVTEPITLDGFSTVPALFWHRVRTRADKIVTNGPYTLAERVVAYLAEIPAGRPFFLWAHLWDAHAPYAPSAADSDSISTVASAFLGADRPSMIEAPSLPPPNHLNMRLSVFLPTSSTMA